MSLELLALCGIPKFRYLTRVLPRQPANALGHLLDPIYTDLILQLIPQLSSVSDSQRDLALLQLGLPKSLGGMSLTRLDRTTTEAGIASRALVVQDLLEAAAPFHPSLDPATTLFTADLLPAFLSAFPRFSSEVNSFLEDYADRLPSLYADNLPGAEVPVPRDMGVFLELFQKRADVPVHFQHKLQLRTDHSYNVEFLSQLSARAKARILSSSHPISSSAFGAFVEADGTRGDELCESDFQIGLLMRVGIPVSEHVLTGRCQLCNDCPNLALDPCHLLSCKPLLSVAAAKRHNRLVNCLANFAANRAGCLVRRELTIVPDRRLRPDLEITPLHQLDGKGFLSDVEVTRADSSSYLAKSSSVPGHQADAGAQDKILKYAKFAYGVPILPLVFEAHGRPSKFALQAIQLISKSAEAAHPPRDDEPSRAVAFETTRSLFHLVSYNLHAGNGTVVRAYLQSLKQKDPSFAYSADPNHKEALAFLATIGRKRSSPSPSLFVSCSPLVRDLSSRSFVPTSSNSSLVLSLPDPPLALSCVLSVPPFVSHPVRTVPPFVSHPVRTVPPFVSHPVLDVPSFVSNPDFIAFD